MALSADRKTPFRARAVGGKKNFPVEESTTIYLGALVTLNAAGYLVPGDTDTTLVAVGTALEHADNSNGADGDITCEVTTDPARFDNSGGGDAIGREDIGSTCYIVDDEAVALTDGGSTRSVAGTVYDVDADGVWVIPPGA